MFLFCSNSTMVDGVITAGTPCAASPATDEAAEDAAMLSRMAHLAEELASGFRAQGVAALAAGDLDRAGKAETHFSSLFLGLRRAVALKARLRQQREDTLRRAATRKDRLQEEKDGRRHAVAQGVSRAIAAGKPESRERLTAGLWDRLTGNERIDADLADTALPIETLILRLGRDIGLSRRALGIGLDPAKADPAAAGPKAPAPAGLPAGYEPVGWRDSDDPVTESASYCLIGADDLGLPGDERYMARVDTGEVFDRDDNVIMRLPVPDNPWRAGATDILRRTARDMAAERAVPRGPDPPVATAPPETDDERRRREREAEIRRYGLTPPAANPTDTSR
jgi:hypothetical protein